MGNKLWGCCLQTIRKPCWFWSICNKTRSTPDWSDAIICNWGKKILCYYKTLPKPTPYYLHCFTTQLSPFLTTMPIHFLKTIVEWLLAYSQSLKQIVIWPRWPGKWTFYSNNPTKCRRKSLCTGFYAGESFCTQVKGPALSAYIMWSLGNSIPVSLLSPSKRCGFCCSFQTTKNGEKWNQLI